MHQGYTHKGIVTDRIDTAREFSDEFTSNARAEVATALGVPLEEVEAFQTEHDPTPSVAKIIPAESPPAPPPDAELDAIAAVLAKPDAEISAGDVKALLLRWARRALARGRI